MSRRNATLWPKVDKMGVGKQGISPMLGFQYVSSLVPSSCLVG